MSWRSLDLQASYENDLVLDLFIGSGTTAGTAVKSGRHCVA